LLMAGRYPVAVILVRLPPSEVDVNVHPAKAEVRFRDPEGVFSAVQRAVRHALLEHLAPPQPPTMFSRPPEAGPTPPHAQPPIPGSAAWERAGIARQAQGWVSQAAAELPAPATPATDRASAQSTDGASVAQASKGLPALRILGQLAQTYILAEGPEGLYLIDQHAAHERVLWERLMAQHARGELPSQPLLNPVVVTLPAESANLLADQRDMLHGLGFEIEPFGSNAFLVRSVPALMIQDDISAALREIVADLETGETPLRRELEARVLRRVCKRMAVKAGRVLSLAEMQALVRDLEMCESPRTCPHGRPTMIYLGLKQLEKEFGRLG